MPAIQIWDRARVVFLRDHWGVNCQYANSTRARRALQKLPQSRLQNTCWIPIQAFISITSTPLSLAERWEPPVCCSYIASGWSGENPLLLIFSSPILFFSSSSFPNLFFMSSLIIVSPCPYILFSYSSLFFFFFCPLLLFSSSPCLIFPFSLVFIFYLKQLNKTNIVS